MKQALKKILRTFGWQLSRRNRYTTPFLDGEVHSLFDYQVFRVFAGDLNGRRFVQIGANDGVSHDPLRRFIVRYGWTGVMVEPAPVAFAALQKLYADNSAVRLVRAAVDTARGERALYMVSDAENRLPAFVHVISSFHREHLLSFAPLVPDIERHIVAEQVACLPLTDILAEARLDEIDVLQIDTEGHDDVVLGQVDLNVVRPRVIQFEASHIPEARLVQALMRLRAAGYGFGMEGRDVVAVLEPK